MSEMIFGAPSWLRGKIPRLTPESLRSKRHDDALSNCREIAKRGHHRRTLKNVNVAESYLAGNLYMRLIAAPLDRPFGSEVRYYYAFFKIPAAGNYEGDLCIADKQILHDTRCANCTHWDEIAVLVDVAQSTQRPETIVSSFVWLKVDDPLLDVGRNADEFSLLSLDGLSLSGDIVSIAGEGKVDVPNIFASSASGDSDHKLVEAGTKVVDRLGNQKKEAVRDAISHFDFSEAISRLRIRLDDNGIRVAIKDCRDFPFDLIDVRVGPINFDARAT
jgi:hypothetical protein